MQRFAQVCQAIAATSSKRTKVAILSEYLASLSEAELPLAATFLSGRPFPLAEGRNLQLGHASIRNVVCQLSGCSRADFARTLLRWGDLGDACQDLLQGYLKAETSLSLPEVESSFVAISQARGTRAKEELLKGLLIRASPAQARFIVKVITSDLRIGLVEGLLEEAIACLGCAPLSQVRRANMLLGDIGQTALLARQGRLDTARMRLFHPLSFMLASPLAEAQDSSVLGTVYVEDKYDGIRAQVHKQGERALIYSRTLDEVSHRFPELLPDILALPGDFILDGEIAAYREGRCLPFAALQQRLGRKRVAAGLLQEVPVVYFAFDVLYYRGELLLERPLRERRQRLAQMGLSGRLCLSYLQELEEPEEIEAAFQQARERGNEGLVIKDPASAYAPGRRGKAWLKLKRPSYTLDVVVTAVEWGHGKRRHVLSDYTFAVRDGEELKVIGKAYSGLTDQEIAELTEWFRAHTIRDFGWGRLVEPAIVIEVAFDSIQPSPRHQSGYALRFPRILRLRPDKGVTDISTLDEVRELAGRRSLQP